MTQDNLYTGEEVRKGLFAGIKKVAEAVGATMGTGGGNSIIEAIESPGHYVTNDGFSIANSIRLADTIENMGKNILLESINRANKASGDGSSTTCVLTAAIIEEGMKHLGEASPMEIKRSLEACIPTIEAEIKRQTREVTVDEVGSVCAISAEDEEIGARIQDIYKEIGKDGLIHWDISKTVEDTYKIGSGLTLDWAGFMSPYMADIDTSTGQFLPYASWKNPVVLLVKQKITSASEFNTLFKALNTKEKKEVIIFCDEIEAPVVNDMVLTRAQVGFKALLVKMPILWKDQWYEDLSRASGAKIIDPAIGLSLKTMTEDDAGTFGNVKVTKDTTFIDGIKDLSAHIEAINDGTDDALNRIARLNTKTARYYVGAHSDTALAYRRLKVEDAISAGKQALVGGIVPGGGIALLNVAGGLKLDTVGSQILELALRAPYRQIIENSSIKESIDPDYSAGGEWGYDTRTGELVKMFEARITDPANVVLNAVRNAIGVAASVLTANTLVTLPRE